jgi:putative acetyltransferase
MDVEIRSETEDDLNAITLINDFAFGGTGESELITNLRKTNDFIPDFSLVALVDDRILGHILFYTIAIETTNNTFPTISLAPMAVHPDYQKKRNWNQISY